MQARTTKAANQNKQICKLATSQQPKQQISQKCKAEQNQNLLAKRKSPQDQTCESKPTNASVSHQGSTKSKALQTVVKQSVSHKPRTSREPGAKRARSHEPRGSPGATSHELRATSHEPGAVSQEPIARSQESRATSHKPGATSQEPGTRKQEIRASSDHEMLQKQFKLLVRHSRTQLC